MNLTQVPISMIDTVSGDAGKVLTSNGSTLSWTASSTIASGIGVNQTWQNVTASRAFATTYTNDTGKPIMVAVTGSGTVVSGVGYVYMYIDNVEITANGSYGQSAPVNVTLIVPAGSTYKATQLQASLNKWFELR